MIRPKSSVLLRQTAAAKGALPLPIARTSRTLRKLLSALGSEERELSVLFTGDREIRALNKKFRKKDMATDVLSFPANGTPGGSIGDLVISVPTARRQAREWGVSPAEEMLRLLIHGVLHLHGYDHEKVSRKEAERMRRMERKLFRMLLPELKRSKKKSISS